jgi:AcrR family transcriptional regulator
MARLAPAKGRVYRRPGLRGGRPPLARAGEVDGRILDAARDVFLERGLAGASIDEIAGRARAGKKTIYARFPSKEVLFTAVVMRQVAGKVAQFEGLVPAGATVEERLASLTAMILHWAFLGDTLDLMRLGIAEGRRFPDLAISVHRMARRRCEEVLARLLGEAAQADALGALTAFAPERLATTTRLFTDLAVMPMILRALYGETIESLRAEIGPHVARSVTFFLAACRHGGVD